MGFSGSLGYGGGHTRSRRLLRRVLWGRLHLGGASNPPHERANKDARTKSFLLCEIFVLSMTRRKVQPSPNGVMHLFLPSKAWYDERRPAAVPAGRNLTGKSLYFAKEKTDGNH